MLPLRHLFDNRPLAEMICRHWDLDEQSLEMFTYCRISANAVYPFRHDGRVRILRFSPVEEKPRESILAELELIRHLRARGYNAIEPIPSKKGEMLVRASTPWGDYHACVFARVPGASLEDTALDDGIMLSYGASLGDLHSLSRGFTPKSRRWGHEDVLDWAEKVLKGLRAGAPAALREVDILRAAFSRLPRTPGNYGLVHFDFELDNVFWDPESRTCHAIDFDDAMYHWFAADIERALNSIQNDAPDGPYERWKEIFLKGYRSRCDGEELPPEHQVLFRRFSNLYGYARVLRSVHETWENEPAWMTALRGKLGLTLTSRAALFGDPV